jgi:hypothetical protein
VSLIKHDHTLALKLSANHLRHLQVAAGHRSAVHAAQQDDDGAVAGSPPSLVEMGSAFRLSQAHKHSRRQGGGRRDATVTGGARHNPHNPLAATMGLEATDSHCCTMGQKYGLPLPRTATAPYRHHPRLYRHCPVPPPPPAVPHLTFGSSMYW